MRHPACVIACALLAVTWPAAAQVYKWTDENGKVHYGDKPQGAKPATTVKGPAAGPQSAAPGGAASLEECHTITWQGMRAEEEQRAAQAEEQKRAAASTRTQPRTTTSTGPSVTERERAAAVEKCRANRGVDCPSPVAEPTSTPVPLPTAAAGPTAPPTAAPVPSPSASLPPPPGPQRDGADAAVRRVIAQYGRAIGTQDLALFRSLKPDLTADEEKRLREAFKMIKWQVVGITVESVAIDGDRATVRVMRQDVVNGRPMKPAAQTFRLARSGGGWQIQSIGQ